jgi:hypothetical protein
MRRRTFLAGGAAVVTASLAGCFDPANVLSMREATERALTAEVARSVDPRSEEAALVSEAVTNGSATSSGRGPLLDADDPVAFEGAYYEVSVAETDNSEETQHLFRVDFNPAETAPDSGVIAYGELPSVDREALAELLERDLPADEGFDTAGLYDYPEGAAGESVLVPTQEYDIVVYEGERHRVDVSERRVDEADYRYELTRIADSREAFAEQLRAQYQFRLAGLSSAERDIVAEAVESQYSGEGSDAFDSVVSRLVAHAALDRGSTSGTWLVEYEGTSYISYAQYASDISPAK